MKEWRKLGETVRDQFEAELAERLKAPHAPADRLACSEMKGCYKIKLRASGYRVSHTAVTATVVAVGRRDRRAVYRTAQKR